MSPVYTNIFLLIGTIIGAGIFSLPIALSQAGYVYFIILVVVLTYLLGMVNKLYREIIDHSKSKHQLPGYVRAILGDRAAKFAVVTLFLATSGTLLAYMIIGGHFMGNLLHIPSTAGSLLFYIGIIAVIIIGGSHLEMFDIAFSVIKLSLIAFIILLAVRSPSFFRLDLIPMYGPKPLFAYGSILFALTGVSIMPELKKDKRMGWSIVVSSLLVMAVYSLFAFGYFGHITESAMAIDDPLFDVTGVFTILTPYLLLSWVAFDLLHKDLKVERLTALAITHALPLLLFIIGMNSFMSVISLTGGVFLGYIVLIITAMYRKKFPNKHSLLIPIIQGTFLIGICLEIWHFFVGT